MDWVSFIAGLTVASLAWAIAWVVASGLRVERRAKLTQDEIYDSALRSARDQPYKR
jgi:hypothetical protein